MTLPAKPKAWAVLLTQMLNVAGPAEGRFPVNVPVLARDYTGQVYPAEPIKVVEGRDLPGFEGALIPIKGSKPGWGIAYNSSIRSRGRINWTLAHELGHYLVHRKLRPDGISCSEDDVLRGGGPTGRDIEREADDFAACLLMPFDDYRRQLAARDAPDIKVLSACADRYGVSFVAAALRWLDYTEKRALLVASREGFVLWAKSSDPAFKTGAYLATKRNTVEVPAASVAARRNEFSDPRLPNTLAAGAWLPEEVTEMTIFSDQYDMTLSILLLGDAESRRRETDAEDPMAAAVDRRWG
jgi:hypothetical protein